MGSTSRHVFISALDSNYIVHLDRHCGVMGRKRTFPPLKDGCAVEVGKEIGTTCWAQYKVPIVVYISVWFRTEKMNRVIMGTS